MLWNNDGRRTSFRRNPPRRSRDWLLDRPTILGQRLHSRSRPRTPQPMLHGAQPQCRMVRLLRRQSEVDACLPEMRLPTSPHRLQHPHPTGRPSHRALLHHDAPRLPRPTILRRPTLLIPNFIDSRSPSASPAPGFILRDVILSLLARISYFARFAISLIITQLPPPHYTFRLQLTIFLPDYFEINAFFNYICQNYTLIP